jgi:hypothetical protein
MRSLPVWGSKAAHSTQEEAAGGVVNEKIVRKKIAASVLKRLCFPMSPPFRRVKVRPFLTVTPDGCALPGLKRGHQGLETGEDVSHFRPRADCDRRLALADCLAQTGSKRKAEERALCIIPRIMDSLHFCHMQALCQIGCKRLSVGE